MNLNINLEIAFNFSLVDESWLPNTLLSRHMKTLSVVFAQTERAEWLEMMGYLMCKPSL